MAEPPDLQDLAKRYLDLWQDQLRAMAADPDMMASVGRMLAAAAGGLGTGADGRPGTGGRQGVLGAPPDPFAWWQALAAPPVLTPMGGATPFDTDSAAGRSAAEARAQAAAAASDGGGDGLRDLERRLAALEARIGALEPDPRAGRGRAKRKPGKGGR